MIIVRLRSGLGNQMFQYAFFKQMQHWYGKDKVKLDVDTYIWNTHNGRELGKVFSIDFTGDKVESDVSLALADVGYKIKHRILRRIRGRQHKSYRFWDKMKFEDYKNLPEDVYLEGFWNEEVYFKDVEIEIRNLYQFPKDLSTTQKNILVEMESTESVGIHVRRGDYVKYPDQFPMCKPEYYNRALALINKSKENLNCFVFSDDLEWCKENLNLGTSVTFVENKVPTEAYKDMHLMSKCKHNVIANSTFSWWAAWLNQNPDKVVVYPSTVERTYASMPTGWRCMIEG